MCASILKAQSTRDGRILYVGGRDSATEHELGAVDYTGFLSLARRHASAVRLVGSAENVDLAIALYDEGIRVELASPLVAPVRAVREDPAQLFAAVANYHETAGSRGGWHRMGPHERAAYELAAVVAHPSRGSCLAALEAHPAYRAIEFIDGVDHEITARLLARILDPRYYCHPDTPDRSKLQDFLGLENELIAVAIGRRPARKVPERKKNRLELCRLVVAAWMGRPFHGFDDPRRFLWRTYYRAVSVGEASAVRSASQLFVAFLRSTWLDTLYHGRVGDGLFVPRHFFTDEDVALACETHFRNARVSS